MGGEEEAPRPSCVGRATIGLKAHQGVGSGVPRTAGEAQARPRALFRSGWRRRRRRLGRRQRGWHGRHPWVPAVVRACGSQGRPEAGRPGRRLPGGAQRKRARAAHGNKEDQTAASAPAAPTAGSGGRRLGRRGSSAPGGIARQRCRGEQRRDRALRPACVWLQRYTSAARRRHGGGIGQAGRRRQPSRWRRELPRRELRLLGVNLAALHRWPRDPCLPIVPVPRGQAE